MNNKVLDRTDLTVIDTTKAAQLQRVAQDVLSGVADRAITVACTGRSPVDPADLATVERDVLIELAFEHPTDIHHTVVVLADASTLATLFALDLEEDGVSLAADAVIRLGDIISAFLDTLVGGLTWLQPTPRVWLANIEQLTAEIGGGFRCDLPAALAAEPALSGVRLTLGTDDAGTAELDLLIGQGAEEALFAPSGPMQAPVNAIEAQHTGMHMPRAAQQQPAPARQVSPLADAAQQPAVQHVQFAPLETERPARATHGIDLIRDVPLKVSVELGSTSLTVREVLALGPGSVVALDRLAGEPVDVLVNDRLIARGEVVIVDESFGVRVSEIIRENGARGRS